VRVSIHTQRWRHPGVHCLWFVDCRVQARHAASRWVDSHVRLLASGISLRFLLLLTGVLLLSRGGVVRSAKHLLALSLLSSSALRVDLPTTDGGRSRVWELGSVASWILVIVWDGLQLGLRAPVAVRRDRRRLKLSILRVLSGSCCGCGCGRTWRTRARE
jgi:hypothetical protein